MIPIVLHLDTPPHHPPSTVPLSARAVNAAPTHANADDHFDTKAQNFSRNSLLATRAGASPRD